MKTLEVAYVLNDHVTIKELDRPGIIRGVQHDTSGTTYRVSFWGNGERKEIWVYADELIGA